MTNEVLFISATPVLASLDIERSVDFFCSGLGFEKLHVQQGVYGVIARGGVSIHFWACSEKHIAESTSCRIRVEGVEALYSVCTALGVVHPNAALESTPWGSKEFGILDPDGNLVTFSEHAVA
jgi:catechol 2,3-dioxygenase-like lactoylglutathione lyase family enzyme